eukprot:CAMPEP_0113309794 /NCGR_PEP_ID=MMETSP0010_2-20120614/7693_1 /TAXON_ID=216773 ORGANISM="Corethron hystrix, Strain 308" /NCGR_SAMPLE_ID=MMETSP0010_2 /ASSEMBLY_ACC=CAM_ASM_000155 /LENGTH=177 /DNA_ID=CAMNT_0000165113 /DNA_START=795 /DNA_END=1325 /DNA_ORIENTATION=- /assembly_acc=CAM_ASM_000155
MATEGPREHEGLSPSSRSYSRISSVWKETLMSSESIEEPRQIRLRRRDPVDPSREAPDMQDFSGRWTNLDGTLMTSCKGMMDGNPSLLDRPEPCFGGFGGNERGNEADLVDRGDIGGDADISAQLSARVSGVTHPSLIFGSEVSFSALGAGIIFADPAATSASSLRSISLHYSCRTI